MGVKVRKYKGSWYVFIDHQGFRKAKRIGSRIAAEKVRREIEARLALGQFGVERKDTSPTFASYSAQWLNEHARLKCKPSTAGFYEQYLRLYVLPSFGTLRLHEITRQRAKDLVEALCKRSLARNTIRLALTAVRSVLDAAMEDGLIRANPAVRLGRFVKSQKPEHEASALTAHEAKRLLRGAKEWCPKHYPMLLTAVRAGLRRGELAALRWGDIRFGENASDTNRYILVQRNFDQRWSRSFSTPKSKKARRVDLSRDLRTNLLDLRNERLLAAFAGGLHSIAENLVFSSQSGSVLNMNNFIKRTFVPLVQRAGLRKIRFHDLRHTFGSLLIQHGASLAYVKEQMGHSSIQVTVDTYGHLVPGGNIEWVDRLDEMISPQESATPAQPALSAGDEEILQGLQNEWLGGRDSNPDTQIQSLQSYR